MPSNGPRGFRGNRALAVDLAMIAVLALSGWVYTFELERFVDIGLYDESMYLDRGLSLPDELPSPENGPLYAAWYYLLSIIQPDAVGLYYLSYKLLTILPTLALFVALRRYRVTRAISFLVALGLLLSSANFPTWPKVSHFALVVLLAGLGLSARLRRRGLQATAWALTALIGSYARPELFLSFVLLTGLATWWLLRPAVESRSPRPAAPLLGLLVAASLLMASLGVPTGTGERSFIAFGQHYARNWVVWHGDPRDPWTHWEEIVADDFGDVGSPWEALASNPSSMRHHVLHNARRLPGTLAAMFGSFHPRSFPADIALFLGLGCLLLAVPFVVGRHGLEAVRARIRANARAGRVFALLLLCLLVPFLVSVLWIAPRAHYLLPLGGLVVAGGAVLLFRAEPRSDEPLRYGQLAILCIVPLLLVRPLSSHHDVGAPQENLATIHALRSLDITDPVDVLEAEGGYGIYLGDHFRRVAPYDKTQSFTSFLERESIDLVVVSDRLLGDSRFLGDPEWRAFIQRPSDWGFVRLDIPGVPRRSLLIRRSLQPGSY